MLVAAAVGEADVEMMVDWMESVDCIMSVFPCDVVADCVDEAVDDVSGGCIEAVGELMVVDNCDVLVNFNVV